MASGGARDSGAMASGCAGDSGAMASGCAGDSGAMAAATGGAGDSGTWAPACAGDLRKMAAALGSAGDSWEYDLRKYLLLLATLVATITYTAGFNPPGGVWQDSDDDAGHLAGDPIIRYTSYRRYLTFYYTNATAFASSLVVIVLIFILAIFQEKKKTGLGALLALRFVMVLDLFSLMGAYAAGTCRDVLTVVCSSVLAFLVVVYLFVQMILAAAAKLNLVAEDEERRKDLLKQQKMLMLLATFAASVTYLAGLNAPGGFWDHFEPGHRPGDAVLKGRYDARLKTFFVFNTMGFMASLLIIVLLLDYKLRLSNKVKKTIPRRLYAIIVLALIGLIGAYSAGSCREIDTSIYVNALIGAVLLCIGLQVLLIHYFGDQMSSMWQQLLGFFDSIWKYLPLCKQTSVGEETRQGNSYNKHPKTQSLEKAKSLVLLLATLAATITYQAGLDPPGGLWEDNGEGYKAGDPILLTTNPRRYKAFFYCNSVAFVASLVAIILVRNDSLHKHNSLEAAMILDLFGLIGAYAAGSSRDVTTSIYAMALAGAVLVYVVIHVVFFTLDHEDNEAKLKDEDNKLLEKRRKRLLLFAILAATITYQAGLTPPSGFRLKDDERGHHAGDPVLYYNFPRRYKAFFYCNSVSFMLSIALIILLVNKNLYRPAIRSNALSVCTAAGMLSLVGAYAAGSTQHLKTSIYIFALAAFILILVAVLVGVLWFVHNKEVQQVNPQKPSGLVTAEEDSSKIAETGTEQQSTLEDPEIKDSEEKKAAEKEAQKRKSHAKRKYLMLLGILVASVTYQAGLEPPGGVWQSDGIGHNAGNPIMHDNRRPRYLAFFYSNSTSFVASVVVIMLLLLESLQQEKLWPFRVMNTTIALDLLGLLIAYAVGSSRSPKTTGYVFALVIAVLAYISIHVMLSCIIRNRQNIDGRRDGEQQEENV